MCYVSLVSIRRSHLWHGQLPVRLRGAERRGPMSVSIAGATAGSGWKNLCGYVAVFIYLRRPENWALCCHSLAGATNVKHHKWECCFLMLFSAFTFSDNQMQLFWQSNKRKTLALKRQFGNSYQVELIFIQNIYQYIFFSLIKDPSSLSSPFQPNGDFIPHTSFRNVIRGSPPPQLLRWVTDRWRGLVKAVNLCQV